MSARQAAAGATGSAGRERPAGALARAATRVFWWAFACGTCEREVSDVLCIGRCRLWGQQGQERRPSFIKTKQLMKHSCNPEEQIKTLSAKVRMQAEPQHKFGIH